MFMFLITAQIYNEIQLYIKIVSLKFKIFNWKQMNADFYFL